MNQLLTLLFLFLLTSGYSQYNVTGKILSPEGDEVESAVVFLKDSQFSAISDENGKFILENVPQGNYILVVTYLGFQNIELPINLLQDEALTLRFEGKLYQLDEIEVTSNQLENSDPFTHSDFTKTEMNQRNSGEDITYMMRHKPSMVVTSDAGAGIGYSSIRMRGTDQRGINVTINGVPVNDAESHNVFWVNTPDLINSISKIQIQRGVGPSTHGAGSYGGSISISTNEEHLKPYVEVGGLFGSFNSYRGSVKLGTGLINNKYSIDARYSLAGSDGYIDRASSELSSYYISASKKTSDSYLKFLTFSGKERTYQAWNGVPISKVNGDSDELDKHYNNNIGSLYKTTEDSLNLYDSDRRYNAYQYEDQVDDYGQSYYQLHYGKEMTSNLFLRSSLFYTRGKGFFEQFRYGDDLKDYGISDYINGMDTISEANLVRRRWLDNHYFGGLASLDYRVNDDLQLTYGGLFSKYIGDHYGQVISVDLPISIDKSRKYYDNAGEKLDWNMFVQGKYNITQQISVFGDVQWRNISYDVDGIDNDGRSIDIEEDYSFINPKLGINYNLGNHGAYASLGVANREPNRSDFLDNFTGDLPSHETLFDYELGYKYQRTSTQFETNLYYMDYKDQLILTGDLNDVGSAIRVNTPESYRMGVEVSLTQKLVKNLDWVFNVNLSRNKIKEFDQVYFDYTDGFEKVITTHEDVDIAFSPNAVLFNELRFYITPAFSASLESKYVGKQYLDNTQSDDKSLDAYFVNNVRLRYTLNPSFANKVDVLLTLNNVFNTLYSNNGYTYSYKVGDLITETFLFPQADFNASLGATVKF